MTPEFYLSGWFGFRGSGQSVALTREQSREGAHRSTDVWRLDGLLRLVPRVDVDESVSEAAGALGRRYLRSHPGIEEAEGTRALVLELVEGPTLADRISKGPIPLDEALPMAKQIAEALETAHESGVIHRDLNGVYRR